MRTPIHRLLFAATLAVGPLAGAGSAHADALGDGLLLATRAQYADADAALARAAIERPRDAMPHCARAGVLRDLARYQQSVDEGEICLRMLPRGAAEQRRDALYGLALSAESVPNGADRATNAWQAFLAEAPADDPARPIAERHLRLDERSLAPSEQATEPASEPGSVRNPVRIPVPVP